MAQAHDFGCNRSSRYTRTLFSADLNSWNMELSEIGFNYQFDALQPDGKPNELNDAFTELLHSPHASRYAGFRAAQGIAPILKLFVCMMRSTLQADADMSSRSLHPAGTWLAPPGSTFTEPLDSSRPMPASMPIMGSSQ